MIKRLLPRSLFPAAAAALLALILGIPLVVHAQTPANQAATGQPRILASAEGPAFLFADTSGIADGNGLPFTDSTSFITYDQYTYRWIRVDVGAGTETNIGGDSERYHLVAADIGRLIKVQVSFMDDDDYSESVTSLPFGPVAEPADPLKLPVTLVSNTGQADSSTAVITGRYTQRFRLGKHGQGYEISSVLIDLAAAPSSLTVSLWIGGPQGTQHDGTVAYKLFDFTNPPSFKVGLNTFTAPAGAFAYQNVNHFIRLSDFGSSLSIKETTSDDEDAGGETGASIHDSSSSGQEVLRLALEGSTRDRGILAANYTKHWNGAQEIVSLGDDIRYPFGVGAADRYLIRGFSLLSDDSSSGAYFANPFVLVKKDSDRERFSLTNTRWSKGISVWTAPQGATVEGNATYDLYGQETDLSRPRLRSTLGRIWGPSAGAGEDVPTAPGVTLKNTGGDVALPDALFMALLGEPLHAMVQNLGQTDAGYVSIGATSSQTASQGFRTGSSMVAFRLQGIGVNIEGSDNTDGNADVPGGPSSVSVAVHADANGKPGAKLFDLVSPDEYAPGHSFFEAPPGTTLTPNTDYVMVWSRHGGNWHRLQRTKLNGEDSGALTGFSIADAFYTGANLASLAADSDGHSLEIAVYGDDLGEQLYAMVSNLGQSNDGYHAAGGTGAEVLTQGFTTGSDASKYRLHGIDVNIEGSDDSNGDAQVPDDASSVSVAVHEDSNGEPGDKLFDLDDPDDFDAGPNFFEAPADTMLEPDTSYVLVWSHLSGTKHRLQRTSSDGEDSGGLRGYSIADAFYHGADTANLAVSTDGHAMKIAVYGVGERRPIVSGGRRVPRNWFHLPEGAQVGDQFRVAYVTHWGTDGTSGDVAYYDALVRDEAEQEYNDRIIRKLAPELKAVVCTKAVDARRHTGMTDGIGVPVHWLDGGWDDLPTLVANTYDAFYGGGWVNHEYGAIVTGNTTYFRSSKVMWTGCDAEGAAHPTAHLGSTMGMGALGAPRHPNTMTGPVGAIDVDGDYLADEIGELNRIYAISPVLTVGSHLASPPAEPDPVPPELPAPGTQGVLDVITLDDSGLPHGLSPKGVWANDDTVWVTEHWYSSAKLVAYDRETLNRDSAKDIVLRDGRFRRQATSIWSDGTTMWVADDSEGSEHDLGPIANDLYASKMTPGDSFGDRDPGKDIEGGGLGGSIRGVWGQGNRIWAAYDVDHTIDDTPDSVSPYNKTGRYLVGGSIILDSGPGPGFRGNQSPTGIWGNGTTMWVADWISDRLWAYRMSNGARDPAKDFSLHQANDSAFGFFVEVLPAETYDRLWVVDTRGYIFRYEFPKY